MREPRELFRLWYVRPLRILEEVMGADSGFIAVSIACFLYERYVMAVLQKKKPSAVRKAEIKRAAKIKEQLEKDFGIDGETAEDFWDVIRNGLAYGAMPKQKDNRKKGKELPRWKSDAEFTEPIHRSEYEGEYILEVQPWLFANKVLELWQENLDLLGQNKSFPWANIIA